MQQGAPVTVDITLPGLALRLSQPYIAAGKAHWPWLDLQATLSGLPPLPLTGILGRTFVVPQREMWPAYPA